MDENRPLQRTTRTALHRRPARGSYDRALAYAIIDEALICSAGFVVDGQPYVLPMAHARVGDEIMLHGAAASRLLTSAASSAVCLTFTLLDGLVLARSAMHLSMNFRSVVVLAEAREVVERAAKLLALHALIEHVMRGRAREVRPPNDKELAATKVLAVPVEEASIKVRSGGPIDDDADLDWPCWAGEVPLGLVASAPRPAPELDPLRALPEGIVHGRLRVTAG